MKIFITSFFVFLLKHCATAHSGTGVYIWNSDRICELTLSRRHSGMSQVCSQEYSPRSHTTFSPLSRNLEQPRRERAWVLVVDRGHRHGKSHAEISYEPRASDIHNWEVVSGMQSWNAMFHRERDRERRCILCAYDRFINAIRFQRQRFPGCAHSDSRDLSVVLILVPFYDFDYSRILSLWN